MKYTTNAINNPVLTNNRNTEAKLQNVSITGRCLDVLDKARAVRALKNDIIMILSEGKHSYFNSEQSQPIEKEMMIEYSGNILITLETINEDLNDVMDGLKIVIDTL